MSKAFLTKRLAIITAAALFSMNANAALVEVWQSGSALNSLADAEALIAGGAANFTDDYAGLIDYDDLGDGTRGLGTLDNPWPGNVNTDFAARITGSLDMVTAAIVGIFINHDDGARLTVNGTTIYEFGGTTDNRIGGGAVALNAGANLVEILFFERAGGASLEFYAGGREARNISGLRTVPEPGTLALLGLGLFGTALAGRRKTT